MLYKLEGRSGDNKIHHIKLQSITLVTHTPAPQPGFVNVSIHFSGGGTQPIFLAQEDFDRFLSALQDVMKE